jgi:hypothetical protein
MYQGRLEVLYTYSIGTVLYVDSSPTQPQVCFGSARVSNMSAFLLGPAGKLFDVKDAHKKHQPRGYEHILDDEPDYCGFLRGRVARNFENQLIVVCCREEALARDKEKK